MKKLFRNLFTLSAAASLVFLLSCNEDGEEPTFDAPTVTITSADFVDSVASGAPGDEISIEAEVNAPGVFDHLDVTVYIDDQNVWDTTATRTPGETPTSFSFGPVLITLESAWIGKTVEVELQAGDDNSQLSELITLSIEVTSPEARSYSAILLAAPLGATTAEKTSETFFSTNTGLTYSMKEVLESSEPLSADIDFGYFFGSGDLSTRATLSDPASYPFAYGQADWGTRNSTTFRGTSLDESAFVEVTTWAAIDTAFENADAEDEDPGIESALNSGDVLAFQTDSDKEGGSKKGLILVKDIVDGNGDGTFDGEGDYISLDIIVQEEAETE